MARKPEPEKAANHERWLVSYADFITLLFAFFVVMFASSQADTERTKRVQTSMEKAFSNFGSFPTGTGSTPIENTNSSPLPSRTTSIIVVPDPPPLANPVGESGAAATPPDWETSLDSGTGAGTAAPTPAPTPTLIPSPAQPVPAKSTPISPGIVREETLYKELQQLLKEELQNDKIEMREEKRGIVISLRDVGFFDSGSATLKPASLPILGQLGARLQQLVQQKGPPVTIRIEGHTDNDPLSPENQQRFRDNFGLSTERANAVVRNLIVVNRFPPVSLVASGYGSGRPIDKNDTPVGKAHNRRVDIVILNEEYSSLEAPLAAP